MSKNESQIMKNASQHVTITEAAKIIGISACAMRSKVHRRMNEDRQSSNPIPKPKRVKHRGQYRWVFDREKIEKYSKT